MCVCLSVCECVHVCLSVCDNVEQLQCQDCERCVCVCLSVSVCTCVFVCMCVMSSILLVCVCSPSSWTPSLAVQEVGGGA